MTSKTSAYFAGCAVAFLFLGIADKPKDAARVKELDGIDPVNFEHVQIVGIDREKALGLQLDRYIRKLEDAVSNSGMQDPLKTQIMSSMDVVTFKGQSVLRVRIPRQTGVSFVGDACFIRNGTGTHTATGPQIAAVTKLFM